MGRIKYILKGMRYQLINLIPYKYRRPFILYFSIQFACLYKSYHDLQDSIIIHENTTIQEIK